MKKMNWLYLVIVVALVVSCSTDKARPPRAAISVAQLFIDTIFENPKIQGMDSALLKKLWDFDEELYRSSSKSKKFIITRKVNPCCPCSGSETTCCMCLVDTEFASMTGLNANLLLDGADMKVSDSPMTGVDLFAVPRGTSTGKHTLKIKTNLSDTLKYTIIIEADGTMKF